VKASERHIGNHCCGPDWGRFMMQAVQMDARPAWRGSRLGRADAQRQAAGGRVAWLAIATFVIALILSVPGLNRAIGKLLQT
jgi:hypothetical protein